MLASFLIQNIKIFLLFFKVNLPLVERAAIISLPFPFNTYYKVIFLTKFGYQIKRQQKIISLVVNIRPFRSSSQAATCYYQSNHSKVEASR